MDLSHSSQKAQRGSAGIVRGRTAWAFDILPSFQREGIHVSPWFTRQISHCQWPHQAAVQVREGRKQDSGLHTQFEQREVLGTGRRRWARSNFMVTIPALAASHLSRRKRSVDMPLHGYVEQKCIYENIGTWKHYGALRCETAFQHSALGRVLGPLKGKATSRPNCETLALYIMVGITSGWIGVYNFLFIIA